MNEPGASSRDGNFSEEEEANHAAGIGRCTESDVFDTSLRLNNVVSFTFENFLNKRRLPRERPSTTLVDLVHPVDRKFEQDGRVLILFDLNGVLVHHTFDEFRRQYYVRPGLEHLCRLVPHYRLGVYSSATERTVVRALARVNNEIQKNEKHGSFVGQESLPESPCSSEEQRREGETMKQDGRRTLTDIGSESIFEVILCRNHCILAKDAGLGRDGGRDWDTVKPLSPYFEKLSHVMLIDDSPHKSMPVESSNMIVLPTWCGPNNPEGSDCTVMKTLVDALLENIVSPSDHIASSKMEHSRGMERKMAKDLPHPCGQTAINIEDKIIDKKHYRYADVRHLIPRLRSLFDLRKDGSSMVPCVREDAVVHAVSSLSWMNQLKSLILLQASKADALPNNGTTLYSINTLLASRCPIAFSKLLNKTARYCIGELMRSGCVQEVSDSKSMPANQGMRYRIAVGGEDMLPAAVGRLQEIESIQKSKNSQTITSRKATRKSQKGRKQDESRSHTTTDDGTQILQGNKEIHLDRESETTCQASDGGISQTTTGSSIPDTELALELVRYAIVELQFRKGIAIDQLEEAVIARLNQESKLLRDVLCQLKKSGLQKVAKREIRSFIRKEIERCCQDGSLMKAGCVTGGYCPPPLIHLRCRARTAADVSDEKQLLHGAVQELLLELQHNAALNDALRLSSHHLSDEHTIGHSLHCNTLEVACDGYGKYPNHYICQNECQSQPLPPSVLPLFEDRIPFKTHDDGDALEAPHGTMMSRATIDSSTMKDDFLSNTPIEQRWGEDNGGKVSLWTAVDQSNEANVSAERRMLTLEDIGDAASSKDQVSLQQTCGDLERDSRSSLKGYRERSAKESSSVGFSALHHEIVAFARAAAPSSGEIQAVQAAVTLVDRAAKSIWKRAYALPFGSQATGLALPGADVDIVVLGVGPELKRAGSGFSFKQRLILSKQLEILLNALKKQQKQMGLYNAEIIGARIPIIKCNLQPPGSEHSLPVDISIGAVNGTAAVEFLARQILSIPPLRPLVLVIKAMLRDRGLNEVFTGGLGSYAVVNMVLAHLQSEGYEADLQALGVSKKPEPGRAQQSSPKISRKDSHTSTSTAIDVSNTDSSARNQAGSQSFVGYGKSPDAADVLAVLSRIVRHHTYCYDETPVLADTKSRLHSLPARLPLRLRLRPRATTHRPHPLHRTENKGADNVEKDLGLLLRGFFHMYGCSFDYHKKAVSIRQGGHVKKGKWKQGRKPWLLAVEDPQQPGQDICSGSFAIQDVVKEFRTAAVTLANTSNQMTSSYDSTGKDGTSSDPPSDAEYSLLQSLLDVDCAIGRGLSARNARWKLEEKAIEARAMKLQHRSGSKGLEQPSLPPKKKRRIVSNAIDSQRTFVGQGANHIYFASDSTEDEVDEDQEHDDDDEDNDDESLLQLLYEYDTHQIVGGLRGVFDEDPCKFPMGGKRKFDSILDFPPIDVLLNEPPGFKEIDREQSKHRKQTRHKPSTMLKGRGGKLRGNRKRRAVEAEWKTNRGQFLEDRNIDGGHQEKEDEPQKYRFGKSTMSTSRVASRRGRGRAGSSTRKDAGTQKTAAGTPHVRKITKAKPKAAGGTGRGTGKRRRK